MTEPKYTAKVHVTGGRNGVGKTEDGFEVPLKGPVAMGGPGGGANPEQLFAIGFAACFESTLRGAARRLQLDPKGTSIDAAAKLLPREEGGFNLGIDMDITMPNVEDANTAVELVKSAQAGCVYSRATKGNIEVAYKINGTEVA
jgi:Ohr subfamily peroxiredoxin